jgi:hypothetical protein
MIKIIDPALEPFFLEVDKSGIMIKENVEDKHGKLTKVINHVRVHEISHALGFISDQIFFRENMGQEMGIKEFVEGKQNQFNSLISAFEPRQITAATETEETIEAEPQEVADLQQTENG